MRVISGKYRGKRLSSPIGNDIRPTSDMVKESIFNVLQFDISGAKFVDLFSGSGNIGIEAISRGAEKVIFVDNSKESLALIAENLKNIKEEVSILGKDYRDALQTLSGKVDFIFVDAPYEKNCISEICDIVARRDLLSENGYIIYERDKKLDYEISNSWYIKKSKKFGVIVVDYISKVNKLCAFTGSFDPITNGHLNIIDQALQDFDKVQIIIGKNEQKEKLFDMSVRFAIAKLCLKNKPNINVDICEGWIYEYCNKNEIKTIVRGLRTESEIEYEKEIANFNLEKGGLTTIFYKAGVGFEEVSSSAVKVALKNKTTLNNLMPVGIHTMVERLYRQSQGLEELNPQKEKKEVDNFETAKGEVKSYNKKSSKKSDFESSVKNNVVCENKKQRKPLSNEEELKRQERKLKKYGKVNEFEKLVEDYNKRKNK